MNDDSSNGSPFHDVGSIFPSDIDLVSVEPSTTVAEALELMAPNRYSQVPVIENDHVRGVFSLWSLAQHLMNVPNLLPQDVAVEEVMEQIPHVTVDDSVDDLLDHLNRHDAVLVKSPHGVQAVGTGTDVLNYFYRVAHPYVLLKEIELSLRNLIEDAVSGTELKQCIERALSGKYTAMKREPPKALSDMTFEDYRSIVTAKGNWDFFDGILGANKDLAGVKLEQIRKIRNSVFHFRDPLSGREHRALANYRNWLFDKTSKLHQRRKNEATK